jgi:hypothetical protein
MNYDDQRLVRSGAPGRIRTCDTRFRKPLLYPLSYGGGDHTQGSGGEPTTRAQEA